MADKVYRASTTAPVNIAVVKYAFLVLRSGKRNSNAAT
jgi:hypothetical protein